MRDYFLYIENYKTEQRGHHLIFKMRIQNLFHQRL